MTVQIGPVPPRKEMSTVVRIQMEMDGQIPSMYSRLMKLNGWTLMVTDTVTITRTPMSPERPFLMTPIDGAVMLTQV